MENSNCPRAVSGEVVGVLFLMEPLNPQVHELDHQAILKVCNLHDIPLAYLFSGAQ
ncbi:MAG: hypothetical protein AAFV72_26755 [Cyanobacteria bacterium J06635_1]